MTNPMPTASQPDASALLAGRRRILVTGGAGFNCCTEAKGYGGAVVRRLLAESEALVFNLDKSGYVSDLTSIEQLLAELGPKAIDAAGQSRHTLLRVDLSDVEATAAAVRQADPDLVMHLAAESHVDRSIEGLGAFIESNVSGTFHLLQAVRSHWEQLPAERQAGFRFHHISTDEVFCSLGETGRFSETTPYDPRCPYSACKAASDLLVNAWHHTYGLPVVLTNCSNNYGPWQFPEKLIPVVILKAAAGEPIPLYGDDQNLRDWLYVEDHVDVLLPAGAPHSQLITAVTDRPGHDRRYAIDPSRISTELGWQPRHSFEEGLVATVAWYLEYQHWCQRVREQDGYSGGRLAGNGPSHCSYLTQKMKPKLITPPWVQNMARQMILANSSICAAKAMGAGYGKSQHININNQAKHFRNSTKSRRHRSIAMATDSVHCRAKPAAARHQLDMNSLRERDYNRCHFRTEETKFIYQYLSSKSTPPQAP